MKKLVLVGVMLTVMGCEGSFVRMKKPNANSSNREKTYYAVNEFLCYRIPFTCFLPKPPPK